LASASVASIPKLNTAASIAIHLLYIFPPG
jgi:hypothetical protein